MPWTPAPRGVSNSDSAAARILAWSYLALTARAFHDCLLAGQANSFRGSAQNPVVIVFVTILFFGVYLVILFRYGLLSMAASWMIGNLTDIPFPVNFSAWWAGYGAVPVVLTLGLAIWAFRTAVAGRPLLREELLEG
jgi:hypothetical protein